MRNRLSPRFDPVEVVKVVVFKVLRVTSSKYARIKRKFTQKPIFNYLDYLGEVNLASPTANYHRAKSPRPLQGRAIFLPILAIIRQVRLS